MSLSYELRHGSYYLVDLDEVPNRLTGERTIHLMTDEVAIAFDRDSGTLLKHGSPKQVDAWVSKNQAAYRASGFEEQANAMVVISGAFPVEELNACLGNISYVQVLFDKLQKGLLTSAKAPPPVEAPPPVAEAIRSMFPGRR